MDFIKKVLSKKYMQKDKKFYDDFFSKYPVNVHDGPDRFKAVSALLSGDVLDVACGTGTLADYYSGKYTGVDISEELIVLARKHSDAKIKFLFANAERLPFPDQSFDAVIAILALQNIENLFGATAEIARVLKADGRFILVLNHPAFRIPKESFWEFDAKQNIEYRRIGRYLSESRAEIIMNPGKGADKTTVSFHRPWRRMVSR